MKKSSSNFRRSDSGILKLPDGGMILLPDHEARQARRSENLFAEPRINRIKSLQDNLQDIKNCVPQDIKDINELSKKTREILYKTASTKLNVNSKDSVFSDLPSLDPTIRKKLERSRSPYTSNTNNDEKNKQKAFYTSLIKIQPEPTKELEMIPMPNEDDYLGLTKLSNTFLLTATKREETRRFLDACINDTAKDERIWEDVLSVDIDEFIQCAQEKNGRED